MHKSFKIILSIFLFSTFLNAVEYRLQLEKGWQLIGLPSDIDGMRVFNNDNVRLVWYYDGKYDEWKGYSPDNSIYNKLNEKNITPLTSIKRWHGIWVYSYNDWELAIDDETELDNNYKDIGKIDIFEGWNLISLPYKTVLAPEIFDGYKVWKYDQVKEYDEEAGKYTYEKKWQTNQEFSFLDFSEIDEINTKMGFWIHTPINKTLNIPQLSSQISTQKTLDEMKKQVTNTLVIGERKDNFWGWVEKRNRYETVETIEEENTPVVINAISNSYLPETETASDTSTVVLPRKVVATKQYLYSLSKDQRRIEQKILDRVLFEGNSQNNSQTPSINLKNGSTGEVYPSNVNSFYITNSGKRVVSISDMEYSGESFAGKCREKRTFVSIYDFDNDSEANLRKHILFDGTLFDSRMVGDQLYLFVEFEPCIDIEYPKEYLSDVDECRYPEDTVEYNHLCYDVEEDASGELFRYDYEKPNVNDLYFEPKYQYIELNSSSKPLLDPQDFYSLKRLDQKGSFFSVIHIDTIKAEVNKKVSVFGEIAEKHISQNSFYLTYKLSPTHISFEEYRSRTKIEKFDFYPNLEYRASTFVDGELLNDFSLSEHDKVLRVVTVDRLSWETESEDLENRIETFVEQTGATLKKIGNLDNFVDSFKTLESVKFFKDIMITSAKDDNKFYITDLSDSKDPVEGGSIEPIGKVELIKYVPTKKKLLAFGVNQNTIGHDTGVILQSFDIANIKEPERIKSKPIGDFYNSSPAFINWNAFQYNNYSDETGIISFPISITGGTSTSGEDSGIYTYSLSSGGDLTTNRFLKSSSISNEKDGETVFVEANEQIYSLYISDGKIYKVEVEK
jgi:hypothetical protein